MSQTPTIGRIVHYKVSDYDAEQINRRRADGQANLGRVRADSPGFQLHVGKEVSAGDVFPMIITRVDENDTHGVNGQVFLDGNDTYWVMSRAEGTGPGAWSWPPRV